MRSGISAPRVLANSPTEKISQFVDHFLKRCGQAADSYIRDTTHFLQILEKHKELPENTW